MIDVTIPGLHLVSEANNRDAWYLKHKRSAEQRAIVKMRLWGDCGDYRRILVPLVVIITRVGVRTLDLDNLQRAAKSTRDAIAECLGVDDADPRIEWCYAQETRQRFTRGRQPANRYGVRIRIEERAVPEVAP